MTSYFISRHAGAKAWALLHGFPDVLMIEHLSDDIMASLGPGDTVIGTLPVNLIAALNLKGVRYLHLTLDLPPTARGKDLSAEEMDSFGARLEEYHARRV